MSDPNTFSSDKILNEYKRLNELDWRRENEMEDDISELETMYEPEEKDFDKDEPLYD